MFICPKCNIEVVNPAFMPPPPWWQRRLYSFHTPYPVCPNGHPLRNRVLGNLTQLALPLAFLRGLWVCGVALLLGILRDLRISRGWLSHPGLTIMIAAALLLGTIAFANAWSWAGRTGPVHQLTSRACGVALGYMVPAVVASHALYFDWIGALQTSCTRGLLHAVGLFYHGSLS